MRLRVGLVGTVDNRDVEYFHRSAMVITGIESGWAKYGRAKLGSLSDSVGVHRLSTIAAVVVWGHAEDEVAYQLERNRCAQILVVVPKPLRLGGPLNREIVAARAKGSRVTIAVFHPSDTTTAYDLGPNKYCERVKDITRQPLQQEAPRIPRPNIGTAPQPIAPRLPRPID